MNAFREPLDKAAAEGTLVIAAEILSEGGVEGWWIPKYTSEKYGIKTVEKYQAYMQEAYLSSLFPKM
ncbi:MAG: glycine betaine ABC transporter substrate-binding protein [Ahrensia sp.]|nr:glycine betaine ABC transporter substrate-binding protein [Ahrensia sp.]